MADWIDEVKEKNLMGSTQCLTDDHYFCQFAQAATGEALVKTPSMQKGMELKWHEFGELAKEQFNNSSGTMIQSDFKVDAHEVADTYDEWAKDYDADCFNVLGFDSPFATRDHTLAYWPRDSDGRVSTKATILDAGCGTGLLAQMLLEATGGRKGQIHGFDLSKGMLERAKESGNYDSLRQQSVTEKWPFDSNSMDVIMCNGVLVYVTDNTCLEEFRRVAKVGGHIVLMVREDNIDFWQPKMDEMESQASWRLVERSEPRLNFVNDTIKQILYRIYVFQKL
mmetsp:Transcript_27188/g.42506  ORF Transcript_27188/g.42506 Transcript_27188/m.42506 type:complete len:281 (+) Transcript_27188:825-1667(+)